MEKKVSLYTIFEKSREIEFCKGTAKVLWEYINS